VRERAAASARLDHDSTRLELEVKGDQGDVSHIENLSPVNQGKGPELRSWIQQRDKSLSIDPSNLVFKARRPKVGN